MSQLNFHKVYRVEIDASVLGIGAILSWKANRIFFSEKLNKIKQKLNTYEQEFYTIIRALKHCEHYHIPKEFILH